MTRASASFMAWSPVSRRLPDGRCGVVPCVREAAQRHARSRLDAPVVHGPLEVDRDRGTEEVAVLLERLDVRLLGEAQRFAPVAEEDRVRLIVHQEVDLLLAD